MLNQPNPLDYLEDNKDWLKFSQTISNNTGDHYRQMWLENATANRKMVKRFGWVADQLQDAHCGKTCIMLGASPAIKTQWEQIRRLQHDPDFISIGVTSGLKLFLENEVKPTYVMIADADPKLARFWEGMDMSKTKDLTLIANICTHPSMLKMWQGNIKFIAIYTGINKLEKVIKAKYKPVNGCGHFFAALGGQYNVGTATAYLIFGTKIIIFVGNELSFPSNDAEKDRYYADGRKDVKDSWERKPHVDIYGDKVYTNYMFMSLKMMLEDFLGKLSGEGYFFNATEAGIFGVSIRYGNVPWIHQMKLDMAVRQAKNIMSTGEPITEESLLYKPTLKESLRFGLH